MPRLVLTKNGDPNARPIGQNYKLPLDKPTQVTISSAEILTELGRNQLTTNVSIRYTCTTTEGFKLTYKQFLYHPEDAGKENWLRAITYFVNDYNSNFTDVNDQIIIENPPINAVGAMEAAEFIAAVLPNTQIELLRYNAEYIDPETDLPKLGVKTTMNKAVFEKCIEWSNQMKDKWDNLANTEATATATDNADYVA